MTEPTFKSLPMPEWWDRLGRCYLSGFTIIIIHPDHAPLQWQAELGEWTKIEWTPQPNGHFLAVKSEDLKIWVDEADNSDD